MVQDDLQLVDPAGLIQQAHREVLTTSAQRLVLQLELILKHNISKSDFNSLWNM